MRDVRPPGWYDDPSGDPGRLRWWDGSAWTGIGRARMPHERPSPVGESGSAARSGSDGGPGSGGGAGPDILDSERQPRPQPTTRWLVVLLAIGLIAGLVLVGKLPGLGADRPASTNASGAPSLTPAPEESTVEPGPTFSLPPPTAPPNPTTTRPRPVAGRLLDAQAGLSYDVLPGNWRAWDLDPFEGLVRTDGYYRLVQQRTPDGGLYWANVNSGPVLPSLVRADLSTTARLLASVLDRAYYPAHTRRNLVQRRTTVDGHEAYLVRWLATFDPADAAGYVAKSEVVVVLVVDTGRDQPAALYVSLPDPVRSVWPAVDRLLASIRVLP